MSYTIHVAKKRGADQLCSYCDADLYLCFCLCRLLVFSLGNSFVISRILAFHINPTYSLVKSSMGLKQDTLI